jgi:hypothetical protein
MEYAEVYAVVDQRVGSKCDGIIDAIYVDPQLANDALARKQQMATQSDDQQWGVLEYSVTSLLRVPAELTMLCVVYEGDDVGIRPVQLYAQESLAQLRVRELDVEEQIRLMTDELSGQSSSKKDYWWEVCPVLQ